MQVPSAIAVTIPLETAQVALVEDPNVLTEIIDDEVAINVCGTSPRFMSEG